MKKWAVWLGGVIAVLGLTWALLPHLAHVAVINAITTTPAENILLSEDFGFRVQGWSALIDGLIIVWLGMKK